MDINQLSVPKSMFTKVHALVMLTKVSHLHSEYVTEIQELQVGRLAAMEARPKSF
jgi:hypothetical protein